MFIDKEIVAKIVENINRTDANRVVASRNNSIGQVRLLYNIVSKTFCIGIIDASCNEINSYAKTFSAKDIDDAIELFNEMIKPDHEVWRENNGLTQTS